MERRIDLARRVRRFSRQAVLLREDLFGGQFAIVDDEIVTFDSETGLATLARAIKGVPDGGQITYSRNE